MFILARFFAGSLPSTAFSSAHTTLTHVDLASNFLSGAIFVSFLRLTSLSRAILHWFARHSPSFTLVCNRTVGHAGTFPIELFSGHRLVLIDLSANAFSGAIDSFIAPSALSGLLRYYYPLALNLSANAFGGTLPPLSTIDARNVTLAASAARSIVSSVVDVRSQVCVRVCVFAPRAGSAVCDVPSHD